MSGTFHSELNLPVEVEYTVVSKGRPASGPTYDCAGQPAESPEIAITVRYNGQIITELLTEDDLELLREEAFDELGDSEDEGPEYYPEDFVD